MPSVNIHEAETTFSQLLRRVASGQEIIISDARANREDRSDAAGQGATLLTPTIGSRLWDPNSVGLSWENSVSAGVIRTQSTSRSRQLDVESGDPEFVK
jgi:antitoxin (DNA-binding transcriptional repressor) of toxin-antitoxin stability system